MENTIDKELYDKLKTSIDNYKGLTKEEFEPRYQVYLDESVTTINWIDGEIYYFHNDDLLCSRADKLKFATIDKLGYAMQKHPDKFREIEKRMRNMNKPWVKD